MTESPKPSCPRCDAALADIYPGRGHQVQWCAECGALGLGDVAPGEWPVWRFTRPHEPSRAEYTPVDPVEVDLRAQLIACKRPLVDLAADGRVTVLQLIDFVAGQTFAEAGIVGDDAAHYLWAAAQPPAPVEPPSADDELRNSIARDLLGIATIAARAVGDDELRNLVREHPASAREICEAVDIEIPHLQGFLEGDHEPSAPWKAKLKAYLILPHPLDDDEEEDAIPVPVAPTSNAAIAAAREADDRVLRGMANDHPLSYQEIAKAADIDWEFFKEFIHGRGTLDDFCRASLRAFLARPVVEAKPPTVPVAVAEPAPPQMELDPVALFVLVWGMATAGGLPNNVIFGITSVPAVLIDKVRAKEDFNHDELVPYFRGLLRPRA